MLHTAQLFIAPCNEWYPTSLHWCIVIYDITQPTLIPSRSISFLCNPRVSECRESNSPQPRANHFTPFVFPLTLALICGCQHIASGAVDIIEEKWWIRKRGGKTEVGIWETWNDSTKTDGCIYPGSCVRCRTELCCHYYFSSEWITCDPPPFVHICLLSETDCAQAI